MTDGRPAATVCARHPGRRGLIALVLIGLTILSCSGLPVRDARPRGVYHRVKSGETLSAIARAYQVDLLELALINQIDHPDLVRADSVIFIPEASQILDGIAVAVAPPEVVRPAEKKAPPAQRDAAAGRVEAAREAPPERIRPTPPSGGAAAAEKPVTTRPRAGEPPPRKAAAPTGSPPAAEVEPTPQVSPPKIPPPAAESAPPPDGAKTAGDRPERTLDRQRFIWPVKGAVVSSFGVQPNRMYHNGIRIAALEGTPVQAAADGTVIFSAPLKDYGETIIIQHGELYATVYAHLGTRTVRGDVKVRKGDRIAFVGRQEAKEDAGVHFEIRHNTKARNPLSFLP